MRLISNNDAKWVLMEALNLHMLNYSYFAPAKVEFFIQCRSFALWPPRDFLQLAATVSLGLSKTLISTFSCLQIQMQLDTMQSQRR